MLAMVVNDDAGSLRPHGARATIVGTPPGACSLLQGAVDQKLYLAVSIRLRGAP